MSYLPRMDDARDFTLCLLYRTAFRLACSELERRPMGFRRVHRRVAAVMGHAAGEAREAIEEAIRDAMGGRLPRW